MRSSRVSPSAPVSTPVRTPVRPAVGLWTYLVVGMVFGLVLVKSEAASWYRVQEMFRFESFHMFGIIGSAVVTGLISTWLLRKFRKEALGGEPIQIVPKAMTWRRYVFGGLLFGVGWGLAGVCPGPIFALLGAGALPIVVVLLFALLGTWLYGALQTKLPH